MTSSPAKNKYMAALKDNPSPTQRGRSKVVKKFNSRAGTVTDTSPDPSQVSAASFGQAKPKIVDLDEKRGKGSVIQKWQNMAQKKYQSDQENMKPASRPFSMTMAMPPPPPPPGTPPTKYRARNSVSPRLVHQRSQWDADKDIPRGTVANSPFTPTKEPPPPQLKQQKHQWDAERDIPRGVVTNSSTFESNVSASDTAVAPVSSYGETRQKNQWNAQRDIPRGTVSKLQSTTNQTGSIPSPEKSPTKKVLKKDSWIATSPRHINSPSKAGQPDVKAIDSPSRGWAPQEEIPQGAVSRVRSNQFFFNEHQGSPQARSQQKHAQWTPDRDIPRGTVRGMSNMFDKGLTPTSEKVDPPEEKNFVEHVEPQDVSPRSQTHEIVKPTAVVAPVNSHAETAIPPGSDNVVARNDNGSDPWLVPSTPSDQFFDQTGWGEAAMSGARSTDEYEEADWFQSDSFTAEEKKPAVSPFSEFRTEPFKNNNSTLDPPGAVSYEEDEDEDDPYLSTDSGSFAAAIQPMLATVKTPQLPDRVDEEVEEAEEEDIAVNAAPRNLKARTQQCNSISDESPNTSPTKRQWSLKSSSTESSGGSPTKRRGPRGPPSIADRQRMFGGKGGFNRRKKGENIPDVEEDEPKERKRRGAKFFKMFSRKEKGTKLRDDDNALASNETIGAGPGQFGELSPTIQKPSVQRLLDERETSSYHDSSVKVQATAPQSPADNLNGVQDDRDKAQTKGFISTRDDMTIVSEVTNPTVFANKALHLPGAGEKSTSIASKADQPDVASFPVLRSDPPPTTSVDPFDINAPMFSGADPFGPVATKPQSSFDAVSRDAFNDPFFVDDPEGVHVNAAAMTRHVDSEFFADGGKTTHEASSVLQPPHITADIGIEEDAPDPEIEILSSDDEDESGDEEGGTFETSDFIIHEVSKSSSRSAEVVDDVDQVASISDSQTASLAGTKILADNNEPPAVELAVSDDVDQVTSTGDSQTVPPAATKGLAYSDERLPKESTMGHETVKKPETPSDLILPQSNEDHEKSDLQTAAESITKATLVAKEHVEDSIELAPSEKPAPTSTSPNQIVTAQADAVVTAWANREFSQVESSPVPESSDASVDEPDSMMSPVVNQESRQADKADPKIALSSSEESQTSAPEIRQAAEEHGAGWTDESLKKTRTEEEINPVSSDESTQPKHNNLNTMKKSVGVSRVTLKQRMKRYEKKMNRSPSTDEGMADQNPSIRRPTEDVPGPKAAIGTKKLSEENHVSTSAYLGRFKSKGVIKGKAGAASIDERDDREIDFALSKPVNSKPTNTQSVSAGVPAPQNLVARSNRRSLRSKDRASPVTILSQTDPVSSTRPYTAPVLVSRAAPSPRASGATPRSILRKPKFGPAGAVTYTRRQPDKKETTVSPTPTPSPSIDEHEFADIKDPVQRAGIRLLAAAVVPIQAEMRRYLAKRRALHRMWSIIVIQSAWRMHHAGIIVKRTFAARLVQQRWRFRQYARKRMASTKIQAAFRGWLGRDFLEDQHYCATEIQRVYRGYAATMTVYEDIYKVTLVQSIVRMRIATEKATYKMALIIQTQSIIRGYLVRRRREILDTKATAIQSKWRTFICRLNYRFDVIDITTVQNLYRQKAAKRELVKRRAGRLDRAATIIQSQWRSYDGTMNYLHFLADVLIVQSAARRFLARRKFLRLWGVKYYSEVVSFQALFRGFRARLHMKRNRAACTIQKVWRGFFTYAEYMFTIADIVIVQTQARAWKARQTRKLLCDTQKQTAATTIQSAWRRFWLFSNFVILLDSTIMIQSIVRGYQSREVLAMKREKAVIIQCKMRSIFARRKASALSMVNALVSSGTAVRGQEHEAAATVQRYLRGTHGRFNAFLLTKSPDMKTVLQKAGPYRTYILVHAIIKIQTWWRGRRCYLPFKQYLGARKIQGQWRTAVARDRYKAQLSAKKVQSVWRMIVKRQVFQQHYAAVKLQTTWRTHCNRRDYENYKGAKQIQSAWRCHAIRQNYLQYTTETEAAVSIQSTWRSFVVKRAYLCDIAAIATAQRIIRGYMVRRNIRVMCGKDKVARTLQAAYRGMSGRNRAKELHALRECETSAERIQRLYRGHQARTDVHILKKYLDERRRRDRAASTIQWLWGRKREYDFLREDRAATLLQSQWRSYSAKQRFWYKLGCVIQIQSIVRGFTTRLQYIDNMGCIIVAQSIVRRWRALKKRDERVAAAIKVQGFFRMVQAMVDREIRAQKKRREYKKQLRNRTAEFDDAMLEDAWDSFSFTGDDAASVIQRGRSFPDQEEELVSSRGRHLHNSGKKRRQKGAPPASPNSKSCSHSVRKTRSLSRDEPRRAPSSPMSKRSEDSDRKSRSLSRDSMRSPRAKEIRNKKMLLPPSYYTGSTQPEPYMPAHVIRMKKADEMDNMSEVSGLTASTINRAYFAPSRLESLGTRGMTDDLSLEEAWVDVEIHNVKQRRAAKGTCYSKRSPSSQKLQSRRRKKVNTSGLCEA